MTKFVVALFLTGAFLHIGSSPDPSLAQKSASVPAAAKQEIMNAAKAHGVNIKLDKIEYLSSQQMTIVRAPIEGSEKHKDTDFEKGVPVVLVMIKTAEKFVVPNGSYVVKLQSPPNAVAGRAILTDAMGTIVSQQGFDGPLLPVWRIAGGDPCSISTFPLMVITHPGPIPGPGGPYGISFPCADCACAHYNWHLKYGKGIGPEGREVNAHVSGLTMGDECMAAAAPFCPPLPKLP